MKFLVLLFAACAKAIPSGVFSCNESQLTPERLSCSLPDSMNLGENLTAILRKENFDAYEFRHQTAPASPAMAAAKSRDGGSLVISVNVSNVEFAYFLFSDEQKKTLLHFTPDACRCSNDRQSVECADYAFNVSFVPFEQCSEGEKFFNFLALAIRKAYLYALTISPPIAPRAESKDAPEPTKQEIDASALSFPLNALASYRDFFVRENPHPFVVGLIITGAVATLCYGLYAAKLIIERRREKTSEKLA